LNQIYPDDVSQRQGKKSCSSKLPKIVLNRKKISNIRLSKTKKMKNEKIKHENKKYKASTVRVIFTESEIGF